MAARLISLYFPGRLTTLFTFLSTEARMSVSILRKTLLLFAAAALPGLATAQAGSISGTVRNEAGGVPVEGVRIQAINSAGQPAASVLTREDGTYRVANLAVGAYTIMATRLGFALKRIPGVNVTADGNTTVDVAMTEVIASLNPVVTTASRRPEKALEAPASISSVELREIQERPAVTVADHLKGMAGVDVQAAGIGQSNVVARGFNNAFSGSILTLQDYRFAGVPSLRVNVPLLFTTTNEDVERVEVLLGPASALYGPNSANGVLHVITKSPFSSQGTTLTLDGGERSLLRASARHAGLITPKIGFKLSGEYLTANEWTSNTARDAQGNVINQPDPGEPSVFPATAPAGRRGQPNNRNFDLRKANGEARLDIRPSENSEFVTTLGYANLISGIEYTGANGAAQGKNWTYNSVQQRARIGRFFAQAFFNNSNAGNEDSLSTEGTYLLRSGQPIVDKSRVFAAQLQHGFSMAGDKQDFVYGTDFIFTNPRTGNTINGRNEDDDNVTEIGAYVQSTSRLSSKFDFIAALRLDQNNRIEGSQFSPRVAAVFKPTELHNFRLTYNRAFSTPANFSYFLDLIQANNVGGSGYNVRALGNPPKTGWQFNRSCGALNDGLCMKSIFSGANNFIPSSAAAVYPGVIQALGPNLLALLTPAVGAATAQSLVSFLGTLRPTDAQVGSRLAFITDGATNVAPSAIRDITPLEASYNQTIELGYKGIIGSNVRFAVDAWFQTRGDVGNPAGLATPNVFFNGPQLGAYLGPQIIGALIQAGLPQAQAQAAGAQIAAQVATAAGQLPVGIVQFNDERFANGRDIYATYTSQRDQEFKVNGVDLALDWVVNDRVTLAGTYSWVSDNVFSDVLSSNNTALMLNAPADKGSITAKFRDEPKGYSFEVRTRYAAAFPVNSGVFASGTNSVGDPISFPRTGVAGTYVYDGVEAASLVDIGFTKRFNIADGKEFLWSLNGTNILDKAYRTMPGAPQIGRMVVTRLQYSF